MAMATTEHDLGTAGRRPGTTPGRAAQKLLPARSRRPVAWLRQVVDAYGHPQEDGRVRVPLSQAELSEASGRARNCGTVYAYLRVLAPVVERGRDGVVVDLARLEELEQEGGCRRPGAAGGTSRRSFPPPRLVQAAAPLRLVREGPPALGVPATPVEDQELADLLKVLVRSQHQLTEAHRRLVELVGTRRALPPEAEHLRAGPAPVPRERSAKVRKPRGTVREAADPAETDREVLPGQEVEAFSLSRLADDRQLAEASRTEPADGNGRRDWADEELDELVAPLAEACRRTGRTGITDRRGVLEALRPYRRRQVLAAVALVARQVRAGRSTAPFGLLVVKARDGDADYFPPEPPSRGAGPPPRSWGLGHSGGPEETDAEAEAAVAALEADPAWAAELATLDAAVRTGKGFTASLTERVFQDPALLRSYRQHAWRERHPPS